jgi:hypothetical protein
MRIQRFSVLICAAALAGCFQNDNHDEEGAASAVSQRESAAAASTASQVATATVVAVSGFDILDGHGDVTGSWTQVDASTWNVLNQYPPAGQPAQGQVSESSRSACCVTFTMPDGSTWAADIDQMQLTLAPGVSFPITNVR